MHDRETEFDFFVLLCTASLVLMVLKNRNVLPLMNSRLLKYNSNCHCRLFWKAVCAKLSGIALLLHSSLDMLNSLHMPDL